MFALVRGHEKVPRGRRQPAPPVSFTTSDDRAEFIPHRRTAPMPTGGSYRGRYRYEPR